MSEDLHEVLRQSVEEVLEKMFFIRALDDGALPARYEDDAISAHLSFDGDPPGSLILHVAAGTARSIGADFLGEQEDDLNAAQVGEVICELANMICGAVLSRIESTAAFRLGAPRLGDEDFGDAGSTCRAVHSLELGGGSLTVKLRTETPVCPAAEKPAS